MARIIDHEKALILRKEGKSYSQIKEILHVNKSTLSGWLKDYPLPEERIRELRDFSEQRIEKYRETRRRNKEGRLEGYCREQEKNIFPFKEKELYLAGLFLYWGEGSKTRLYELCLANNNPSVIKFFITWLIESLKVPSDKLSVRLQLYQDMDAKNEIKFWSKKLDLPIEQFKRPHIKKTFASRINYKGGFGHGTCNLRIGDARLSEKIHMALKAISDRFDNMGS